MKAIKCMKCQQLLPLLSRVMQRNKKVYAYAYCVNCGIKYDGVDIGAKSLERCAKEVSLEDLSPRELDWLKGKLERSNTEEQLNEEKQDEE